MDIKGVVGRIPGTELGFAAQIDLRLGHQQEKIALVTVVKGLG